MRVILIFLTLLGLLSLLSMIKLPQNTLWQDSMTSILRCSPTCTFTCETLPVCIHKVTRGRNRCGVHRLML